jgi:hypothetical protein
MNTNEIQLAQQIASAAGYHLSGYEVALLLALPHTLYLHIWASIKFWTQLGGWRGISLFFKTGTLNPEIIEEVKPK